MSQTEGDPGQKPGTSTPAERYLLRDPLRHILHLKMLAYHGRQVETIHVTSGSEEGVLLLFPTTCLSYDQQTYGDFALVAMPVADSVTLLTRLLGSVPRTAVVFKLIRTVDEALVAQQRAGTRTRLFANFTAGDATVARRDPAVAIESTMAWDIVAALGRNGYTRAELAGFLDQGGKALSLRDSGGKLISAGLIYPNFQHIWEIAALFSAPWARRQGYAQRIVRTALWELRQQGRTPRYVVEASNSASLNLARAAGLHHFLDVVHFASGT